MRRFLRNKVPGRICIPIIETTVERALKAIQKANRVADLIELRVDYLKKPKLLPLLNSGEKPFIVTNRRKEEGGRFIGDERRRLSILREALALGAEYIDTEVRTKGLLLKDLIENKKSTQIILSFHDFQKTPSQKELQKICDHMIQWGADIAKIVSFANLWEDNLRILSLIPYARKRNQKIVAFCMGEKGKMSRIFAPLMGATWTYASLNKSCASAPGQLTIEETKDIWKRLR
jgi:3-dehydroquinate dehydratase type I